MAKKYEYDNLIVGAGLYGAMYAYMATRRGESCLVIDKNPYIGGFCHTSHSEGIEVHDFGAHIFRTSSKKVWDFVNSIDEFIPFVNSPIAKYHDELYNLPFNMNTFHQMFGVTTPEDAIKAIDNDRVMCDEVTNLEEHVLSLAGKKIYEKLVKEYTEKQWGMKCTELPPSIMKRIPLRFTFDNNYYNDTYQGIPKHGYTSFIRKLLQGSMVFVSADFKNVTDTNIAKKIVYTGSIDELFDYKLGKLEYRYVGFEHKVFDKENYQGNAVVNYTSLDEPYTRTIEHKHFLHTNSKKTIVTYEYPDDKRANSQPSYPIPTERNLSLYQEYWNLAKTDYPNMVFGGRLGEYKYYSMNDIIEKFI